MNEKQLREFITHHDEEIKENVVESCKDDYINKKRFSKCKDQCKVFDWVTNGVLDIHEIVDTLNYYERNCLRYEKIISELKDGTYKEPLPITQRK